MFLKTRVLAIILCIGFCNRAVEAQVDAMTRARHDLSLGFTVSGKVEQIAVKPGDRIDKGQLLIELEDTEGKSLVQLYEIRASSDLAARSAEAALQLAQVEYKAIDQAYENDAAMWIEVERSEIRVEQSELELKMALQQGREAVLQLNQARSRHEQYILRAPTEGIVEIITVEEGELVETLNPVLQLVVIDPLWIDAAVPTDQTLDLKIDDAVQVRIDLPGHNEPVVGKIIHMAEIADAASNTRLVRVEMPNPKLLPAGTQVTLNFGERADSASASRTLHNAPEER